jgi:hypothetical protein
VLRDIPGFDELYESIVIFDVELLCVVLFFLVFALKGAFDFKGNEFYKIARDKFYWSYYYDIEGNPIQELEYFNKAYILLVKRVENNIVGYSIIEVVQDKENLNYCNVEIVESFIFPKIKDKYQDISYEYIRESFNTLKEIRK